MGFFFSGAKGVRQGDPLSPYLLIIGINFLLRLLNLAESNKVFHFHPKCKKLQLTHLNFADDLLVFVKGSIASGVATKEILDYFYYISGLQINTSKTELFSSGISQSDLERIVVLTGIKLGTLPVG